MPRQKGRGKTAIITGAHKGVGKEVVRGLLKEATKVYIASKILKKAEEVVTELAKEFAELAEGTINGRECDLADFESIKKFVTAFKKESRRQKLHYLILNSEVKWGARRWTKQGIELQFGVNHIGHFLLTTLLLDMLKACAPSRIIVVSNACHFYGQINFDDINLEQQYGTLFAHCQSKLANILFVKELSRRLEEEYESQPKPEAEEGGEAEPVPKLVVNAVSPGVVAPGLKHDTKKLRTEPTAALEILHVVFEPDIDEITGKYFSNCTETPTSSGLQSENMEVAAKLWEVSEEYCKRTEADAPVVVEEKPLVDLQMFSGFLESSSDLIKIPNPYDIV